MIKSIYQPSTPERLINDNVIENFKPNHSMRRQTSSEQGFVSLKVDMTKASDRVEWEFLLGVMERICFPMKWCDIVRHALDTVYLSFLINSGVDRCVKPSKGI